MLVNYRLTMIEDLINQPYTFLNIPDSQQGRLVAEQVKDRLLVELANDGTQGGLRFHKDDSRRIMSNIERE